VITDTRNRVGVYGWTPGKGGVHHHRIAEPLRVLASHGVTASHGVQLDDEILSTVDTVLVHTLHDERNSYAWELLAKADSHRLVIDIDDWMWRPDWQPFREHYRPEVLDRMFRNVEISHIVTTPSPVIAEYLTRLNANVHVVPNTVPDWLTRWPMPQRPMPIVGYQGSSSHIRDWPPSQQRALGRFLVDHPDWGVHIYGATGEVEGPPGRTWATGWFASVSDYYRALSMDVGIGPLADTPFNRAKSSLRAVEYAALGVVAVLPDLPPYRGWVEDGVTGRLVRTHQTMRGVLNEVAADDDHRQAMASAARERALQWTTEASIQEWVRAWASR
jgi:glycosyltransferase involved in cell wall biosynthesis